MPSSSVALLPSVVEENVPRLTVLSFALTAFAGTMATGCGDVNAELEELSHARRLSAELLVQFTKAADASNRAVMADTDEASVAFAREADEAKHDVHQSIDALGPILEQLHYADEHRLLREFADRLARYDALDRNILELAVENTNLKAQRLSFGPAQESADAFRAAIDKLVASTAPKDQWRAKALSGSAVESVREIQALQAPHIAEPEDVVMARLEQRMSGAAAAARHALDALATIVPAGSRSQLAVAGAALDEFMKVNAEILVLSHRNTNVRSLALSLTQKPALVAQCEESLRALNDALDKRGFGMSRFAKQGGRTQGD